MCIQRIRACVCVWVCACVCACTQIGVDIKLDQLTPAELAAAERMALRIMGQKAPEAIAARGRKARLEAQNPNLPLEEANDAITRAKDAGRELVEVVLTTEDASEAMAGARLAVGVLGTEDTIAQTAVAGTLAHGAKNKGDHGHATHTYRPGSGGVGEGDGEGGEGDQGGIGEHENEGEDTDNASGQGLPAAGPRPGRLPPLTVQTPPLRPKSAHPAGLERPTSAAPRAKSAHPAGFEPPTSGQQRTRPKSAHPGSVPQDADGGDVEEYPADFERYSVPCTPHEGPQSTAEPGWEGKVGSRVGSARDEYGGSDTQGDGSPRIGIGRPRSPGGQSCTYTDTHTHTRMHFLTHTPPPHTHRATCFAVACTLPGMQPHQLAHTCTHTPSSCTMYVCMCVCVCVR